MENPKIFHGAWKDQYRRVKRWYSKIQCIDRDNSSISEEELDTLFAFFQNCWHLYDWLKNSEVLSVDLLDGFFRDNETMKFCYDICIGGKHLNIDHPKKGHTRLRIVREFLGQDGGIGRTQLILFGNDFRDMTGLAKECMEQVEAFLHKYRLL